VTNVCDHAQLKFGSGGFYVICVGCGARWAAQKDGPMGHPEPDYDRVDLSLNQQTRIRPR
jgi:hypothetical protein